MIKLNEFRMPVIKNHIILFGQAIGRVSDTASSDVVIAKCAEIMAQCGKSSPQHPVARHDGKNWIIEDQSCGWCGNLMTAEFECEHCGGV